LSEIKSTIDIIMERTRGMALSEEERESIRREDLKKRAAGLRLKLTQEPQLADEILSSLAQESGADRRLLESYLWELMIDAIPKDGKVFKYLDLMEKLPGAEERLPALRRLREALKDLTKHQVVDKKKIVTREKKKLAALGISGSAVVPKIPKEGVASEDFLPIIEQFKRELGFQTTK
jgi:hypothetical protein